MSWILLDHILSKRGPVSSEWDTVQVSHSYQSLCTYARALEQTNNLYAIYALYQDERYKYHLVARRYFYCGAEARRGPTNSYLALAQAWNQKSAKYLLRGHPALKVAR